MSGRKENAVFKVVVLGDGGVGKTALTIQLCLNHFVEMYDPTVEDSYRKQIVIDHQSCMVEILDTAGQEEFSALRDQWITEGEGFAFVYSVTSRTSFNRILSYVQQVERVKKSAVPMVLIGNKSDRVIEREVSSQEGAALAKRLGCDFFESSAKNDINIERAFFETIKLMRKSRQNPTPTPPRNIGSPAQGIMSGNAVTSRRSTKSGLGPKTNASHLTSKPPKKKKDLCVIA
ncbi:ras family-domain-containing protein [Lipomyces arxii]|uniref:ras family-domain-containing protein n=1 Tax=Lipomyces arxii TaxID=56418 RepID=UPI0034CDAFA3